MFRSTQNTLGLRESTAAGTGTGGLPGGVEPAITRSPLRSKRRGMQVGNLGSYTKRANEVNQATGSLQAPVTNQSPVGSDSSMAGTPSVPEKPGVWHSPKGPINSINRPGNSMSGYDLGSIIVRYKGDGPAGNNLNIKTIPVLPGETPDDAVKRAQADPNVMYAEKNAMRYAMGSTTPKTIPKSGSPITGAGQNSRQNTMATKPGTLSNAFQILGI